VDIHAKDADILSPLWRGFVGEGTSREFWFGVLRAFGPSIRDYYPDLVDLRFYSTSVRGLGGGLIQLDCQPGINTPQSSPGRVRGPHLDNPIELYAGMLYMGEGEGDLEIYREVKPLRFHGKLEIEDDCVEVVKTVKYQPNMLVMFLNTFKSIHGVTARNATDQCRRMVNFIGELRQPLFRVGHGRY